MISKLLLSLISLLPFASQAAIVFSQDFDHYSSSSVSAFTEGWDGYTGTSDSIAPSTHDTGSYWSGGASGSLGPNGAGGYLVAQNRSTATAGTDYFLFTTTTLNPTRFNAFSPAGYSSTLVTAKVNRSNAFSAGNGIRLTVLVDGSWYVSDSVFTPAAGNGSSSDMSFDLVTTAWKNLDLVTGDDGHLAIGTIDSDFATLFSAGQQVSGIGLYIDDLPVNSAAARTVRIDDVTIETIPEPGSAALVIFSLVPLFRRRR